MVNILKDMLLIEDPSVFRLYKEMINISNYFIAPVFTIALILEYFSDMNFGMVVKKLFLIVIFMGSFYSFHTTGTKIALESASKTLKRVSPSNLFVKKWTQKKIKTGKKKGWDTLKDILIPNLNDVIATTFFLLAKIFIWLLKLIYSTVYHLTYIFAGVTAIFYFLGWTQDALKGTIQASLWCIVMPFVIVAILSLVGNSIQDSALNGDLIITKIDTIIWLFGVTLLLLISPLISYGMIRGDGIHSFGSKMGSMVVSSGIKTLTSYPLMIKMMKSAKTKTFAPIKNLNSKKDLIDNKQNNRSYSSPSSSSKTVNNKRSDKLKINTSKLNNNLNSKKVSQSPTHNNIKSNRAIKPSVNRTDSSRQTIREKKSETKHISKLNRRSSSVKSPSRSLEVESKIQKKSELKRKPYKPSRRKEKN